MDTLIFAGLLLTWYAVVRQRGRRVVQSAWWLLLASCVALLAHHITGGLSLGLTY